MSNFVKDSANYAFEDLARSFRRHRNFITSLKFVLPVIAGILALALLVYPTLYPQEKKIIIESIPVTEDNPNPAMLNPRFSGFDKDDQPYSISAARAYQQDEKKILMEELTADLTLKNGTWASVVTPKGLYDIQKKHVYMDDIFEVFMTEANAKTYHITGSELDVDMHNQILTSNKPVNVEAPMGMLTAGGFIIYNKQSKISFKGPVKLVISKE